MDGETKLAIIASTPRGMLELIIIRTREKRASSFVKTRAVANFPNDKSTPLHFARVDWYTAEWGSDFRLLRTVNLHLLSTWRCF